MRGDSTWACREPRSGSRGALGAGCLRPGAKTTGDLTRYFEFFASAVGDGMSDIARDLEGRQETEQRRPWMTVRPPDQLDRQIFDAVQRLGSATIQQLLGAVHEPPPLRTVQRRLKKLCDKGLLAKQGKPSGCVLQTPREQSVDRVWSAALAAPETV